MVKTIWRITRLTSLVGIAAIGATLQSGCSTPQSTSRTVALSYDHRIVDGKEAVTFLKRIKECVENPERMMMEI